MKFLSPSQIEEVLEIVDRYTLTFVAQSVGEDILTDKDKELLESYGIDVDKINTHSSGITRAFKFGILSDSLGDAAAKKYTYSQFKNSLKEGTFIPLNTTEKAMLMSLKYSTYSDIKKLGGNIKNDIANGIVEVDRNGMARAGKLVRDATKEAIEKRKGVTEVASIIGKKTGQWNRDLLKIAEYNMHQAFNSGKVANIERQGTGSKVYFDVFPGSCKHCIRLYLTAGFASEPILFDIEALRANGTNIGRKVKDWKATISGIHPNCRCTAHEAPVGYKWDASTRTFTEPDKEFKRKVDRKSKVGVTVTRADKETKTVI